MSLARALLLLSASALTGALATGCSATPSHYTRLWVEGDSGVPLIGVSTEAGVLTLSTPGWKVGDRFELQLPHGNSVVYDIGIVDRLNDTVTILLPATSRLEQGRFATSLPAPDEELYLAMRDEVDEPVMVEMSLWREGAYGDWALLPGYDPAEIARAYRGSGVYVHRDGRWQIVGLLGGLLASDEGDPRGEVALGYVGLIELSRILPRRRDYLAPDLKPLRPDFEFGVPLQPGDIQVPEPEAETATGKAPASKPAPQPAPKPTPPAR